MRAAPWLPGVLLVFTLTQGLGCRCGAPPVVETPDGGEALIECEVTGDCPLGESCVGGKCQRFVDPDGGADAGLCTRDEDCPSGEVCLLSRGECVPEQTWDAGEVDAGPVPDCLDGDTRPCGQSKLGQCQLGVETCMGGMFGACVGAVDPVSESCDGRDNDCDGLFDEDYDKQTDPLNCGTCGRVCAFPDATPLCVAGACQMGPCLPGHHDLNGDEVDGCEYACTVTNGGQEACDGLDNDCDGTADENQGTVTCGVGACQTTVPACVSGQPNVCTPLPGSAEICDGVDNNCDGQEDEALGATTCGVGACEVVQPNCVGGQVQTCTPGTPQAEVCDGADNDCNGAADDGLGQTTCGQGACEVTVANCAAGQTQTCTPLPPSQEVCDGADNDCDGAMDEALGQTTCGVGVCEVTVLNCSGGVPQTCTAGTPSPEVCDGQDNDCDGSEDEDLGQLTCGQGECRVTVDACAGGAPQTCTPAPPSAESCDTLDNDCDGVVDEGCLCVDGQTQSCYSGTQGTAGVGVCTAGSQTCAGGVWGPCQGEVVDSPETCDGADNDCDGQPDDGLGQTTCGVGACQVTVQNCAGGSPQTCTPGAPGAEVCDGADNDCDGAEDEGLGQTTCGVGACQRTVDNCQAGSPQSCTPGPSSAEVCDGLDNDCDGAEDEGLGQTTCGVGACQVTVQNCAGGAPQTCQPGPSSAEICDGVDNDCDGTGDEGLGQTTCGVGVCQRTVQNCAGGNPQACMPGPSTAEICDGADNDCDGDADESFPEQGQSCSTGLLGPCAAGVRACTGGVLACQQTVPAQPSETCGNGVDDDCNGTVDDPGQCGCDSSVDNDADGANECLDCNDSDGTVHPAATELCNGKDDDCDGTIDQGFDLDLDGFTTCGTVSGGGLDPALVDCDDQSNFVYPGKVQDCGNASSPNSPNGDDDNCNGYVDETCSCSTSDQDGDGVTECAGDCDDGEADVFPGKTEVCDGLDNDCNVATVDNCGVSEPCGKKKGNSWDPWPAGTDECQADLICSSNISTGELTCGSFCNQTTGVGLGDSCAVGEGCYRNLIDTDNLHLCTALSTGTRTTGQSCTQDAQCRSGDCLSDGTQYCSDKCTHESGCSQNTTCYVERGPLGSPFVFGYYYYSFCRADAQITGNRTTGQTCSGSQCEAGPEACFNGVCTEPCCEHADCGPGFACSINGPRSATGYTSAQGDIYSLLPACLASSAVKVSGQACATSAECRSGICDVAQGVCVDVCCNDASCVNGTTCEPVSYVSSSGEVSYIRACVYQPVPAVIEQR